MALERIEPAYKGRNTEAAPDYLDKNQAPDLANFLVNQPGKLKMRGPLNESVRIVGATPPAVLAGLWTLDDKILANLGGGDLAWAALNDGVFSGRTTIATTLSLSPSSAHATLGDAVYGPSVSGDLIVWTGSGTPTAVVDAPYTARDVANFAERLFVLGGTEPGTGSPAKDDHLWWTDPGGPDGGVLADWQDDVSGLVNQIVLPENGTALARAGRNLVIFHRNSVSVLQGAGSASWSVRSALQNRGLVHPYGVLEYGDAVLFMSNDGLYSFDGATADLLSADVNSELLSAMHDVQIGLPGGPYGIPRMCALAGGYVLVVVTSLTETTSFSKMLHLESGAWTDVNVSTDITSKGFLWPINTRSAGVIYDGARLWYADTMTLPPAETGWDSYDAVSEPIPAVWRSRLAQLSEPIHKSALQQLTLDYTLQVAGADDAALGWYVSLVDGQGNVLLPEVQLPTQGDPSAYAYRRQYTTDACRGAEANDAQLVVEWRGNSPAADTTDATILGAHIEFHPAQRRASG